jgi:hypothetical protein
VIYQVKAVLQNGSLNYSNKVVLQRVLNTTTVYPNPVHRTATIYFTSTVSSNYQLELYNMNGALVQKLLLQNMARSQQRYERPKGVERGMYLLKITNLTDGTVTHHKLLFD